MAQAGDTVEILLPVALDRTYTYRVPFGMHVLPGDVVRVPLAGRDTPGVVWEGAGLPAASNRLRLIEERLEAPALREDMRRFVDWVSGWTLAPRGMVMRMALRAPDPPEERARVAFRLMGPPPARLTPAREGTLAFMADGLAHERREIVEGAGVSSGVIDGLVDEGTLEAVALPPEPAAYPPDPAYAQASLSPDQRQAADSLMQAVAARSFSATLLEGVTGSGKTEVYFEAVAEAVRGGGQALILLPEIALTNQFMDRFAARFGVRPARWHSGVGAKRRAKIWHGVAKGEVAVVAGARSALFLPFARLGLIVVDEEHEAAYKQEDGVHYHARDMAVVRGRLEGCAVVLASATPSIETRVNAARGRYRHVVLPERFGGRRLPDIAAIDMRRDAPERGRFLSPPLVNAVKHTLERGEQALLFLNRRGYAPLTLCRACGHRYQCRNCSTWLVEHRFRRALVCHQCGYSERRPEACTACGTFDNLTACGPGVERIAEEAVELFPDKRVIVLSSDFPGGAERLRRELEAVAAGECDIVVGTQLVAKGHNFPGLTLVGVLDADIGLTSGDPRAAERTFQLLQQVTGRAGRGERPGRALVQTYQPEHPVIAALLSGDAERFYAEEIAAREAAGLPPFGRLAAQRRAAAEREAAEAYGQALARAADPPNGVMVLGPAEAPLALVRGRFRFRLLVKTERNVDLQGYLRAWLARGPKPRGNLRVAIDVDPQSFL